jgi:hypothetical protein
LTAAKQAGDVENSLPLRLLADVRDVWPRAAAHIATTELLTNLRDIAEGPWVELNLTARKLARMLRPFGVEPRQVRIGSIPFESFRVTPSNGQLIYTGQQPTSRYSASYPLTFIGNNKFAYEALNYFEDPGIFGFERNRDGSLTSLGQSGVVPVAKPNDCFYTDFAVADAANHLAVAVRAVSDCPGGISDGKSQLATYSVDAQGGLSTLSTYSNMPVTPFTEVTWMTMAPRGKVLAVAGGEGMQLYHFNGAAPLTKFTGLVATHEIDQMYFDNANHLYALSIKDHNFYVYTITTSGSSYVGSHSVPNAAWLIVQPK